MFFHEAESKVSQPYKTWIKFLRFGQVTRRKIK